MAISNPRDMEALGKPPGWSHPRQMRDWLRKIPQTERIAGAVDRELQKEVIRLNSSVTLPTVFIRDPLPTIESPMNTNRTGLRDSLASLKERAAQSRQKSLEAGEKIAEAFKRQEEATESLNRYADEVTREADDVLAELGQFSNGAPE